MKITRVVVLIMGILSFSSVFGGTPEQQFWRWFSMNEAMLFDFEADREAIFDRLSEQLHKVHPDLTFEFGPVQDGKREFVISAGGIVAAFPAVETLYAEVPTLSRWTFIKFRPRRAPLNTISYGGLNVRGQDVHYGMFRDGEKVGIILFFDGYNDGQRDVFANIGYLFLDEALGEYDVETRVGFIEFHGRDSKYFENARPLGELAESFDAYFEGRGE